MSGSNASINFWRRHHVLRRRPLFKGLPQRRSSYAIQLHRLTLGIVVEPAARAAAPATAFRTENAPAAKGKMGRERGRPMSWRNRRALPPRGSAAHARFGSQAAKYRRPFERISGPTRDDFRTRLRLDRFGWMMQGLRFAAAALLIRLASCLTVQPHHPPTRSVNAFFQTICYCRAACAA